MSEVCRALHEVVNARPQHRFPFDAERIPANGLYMLFETGERGHALHRIVRIGTHTGVNQLRARLHQHFLYENKDRSIFRKNIGRAILNRTKDPFLSAWELDLTSRRNRERYKGQVDAERQQAVESEVSRYIREHLSFVVFDGAVKDERLRLESRLISTVSLCEECGPSPEWLGLFSPKPKIRESGLWQEMELYKEPLSTMEVLALRLLL